MGQTENVLASPAAGGVAARGGLARVAAHSVGLALTTAASVVLLRHLGVTDFGRYATVIALVAIAGGIADAGLTVVGQREHVLARDEDARRRVLAAVAGLRLVLAPLGIALAALFAVVSGQPGEMVLGVVVAGAGIVFSSLAASVAIPLGTGLRLQAIALTELARQAALALAIVLLVVAGARLPEIFVAQPVAAAVLLAATLVALRGGAVAPRLDPRACLKLARRTAVVGLSLVIGVVYVRALVVVVFLVGSQVDAGLYGAASRVIELVGVVPWLVVGSAFPLLAHAGAADERRFGRALRRLAEAGLALAGLIAVCVGLAAEPLVRLLGGADFEQAAPLLRILSALVPALFLTQVWTSGLLAVGAQRAVLAVNLTGLLAVLALGGGLVALEGATGAAIAAVAGEWAIALLAGVLLVRARPGSRPRVPHAWKPVVAAAAGVAAAALTGLGGLGPAAVGGALYVAILAALGGLPLRLLLSRQAR